MTALPTILDPGIDLVNFTLVHGVATAIRVTLAADPPVDITNWSWEVSFFIGHPAVKTVIITKADSGIVDDPTAMELIMTFSAASIADLVIGSFPWDLRYTDDEGVKKQRIKGTVTVGVV